MKAALLLPLLALGALSGPAIAQDEDTAVNVVYITEDEACPPSTEDVITVCGILEDQYRIPPTLRQSGDPANQSWAERVREFQSVGEFGINSCSPTGSGGLTGCTQELIEAAYREREEGDAARFGQLIAEAREERLSTIDEDAAAEQERVEQIEREYMERLERERRGEIGETSVDPDAPPEAIYDPDRVPPDQPEKDTAFEEPTPAPKPVDENIIDD